MSHSRPAVPRSRGDPSVSRLDAELAREPASFDAEPIVGKEGAEEGAERRDREPTITMPDDSPAGDYRVYGEARANAPASEREQPDFLDPEPIRYRGAGFYFWSFLSILGAIVLLAQCLYVYRVQLDNQLPALRPVLERACVTLHCRIPYVRDISQIAIMNSSLQTRPAPDGDRKRVV